MIGGNLSFSETTNLSLNFNGDGAGLSTVDWDKFWHSDRSWVIYGVDGTLTGAPTLVMEDWLDGSGTSLSSSGVGSFAINTSGSDIVLSFTTAIPEPSTFTLMELGLAGFGWAVRRRRQKREFSYQ